MRLDPYFSIPSPFLLLTLVVFIQSAIAGLRSGIFTTAISTAAVIVVYYPPVYSFSVHKIYDIVQLIAFGIQAVLISYVTARTVSSNRQIRDINTRLQEKAKRLEYIMDNVFAFVFIVNPDGTLIEVNKAAANIAGKGDELLGHKIYELKSWARGERMNTQLRAALVNAARNIPDKFDTVIEVESKDKQLMDVAVTVIPVTSTERRHKVDYVIVTARDITERRGYQRELERTRVSYLRLVNSNVIGMFITDAKGQILDVNTAFASLVGWKPKEFVKKVNWPDLFIPATSTDPKHDQLQDIVINQSFDPVEKLLQHKDGSTVPVIMTGILISHSPAQCLCLAIDISERKKLEEKKDEFMSIASHELRTPITTLKGYVQLLQTQLDHGNTADASKFIEQIEQQITKLIALVEELLNSSRIERGKLALLKKDVEIVEFLTHVITMARSLVPKHKINVEMKIEPMQVQVDTLRMEQVLMNLIENAAKYAPDSGKIDITVRQKGKYVVIDITDYGVGIAADKIPFLFDKYFRGDINRLNFTEGLGLGLYISQEIMRLHGGRISVKSKVEQGSTFSIHLPLRQ